jgi:hypothetical protein
MDSQAQNGTKFKEKNMKGSRETTENVQWCMAKRVRKPKKGLENYRKNYRNDRKAIESDKNLIEKLQITTETTEKATDGQKATGIFRKLQDKLQK